MSEATYYDDATETATNLLLLGEKHEAIDVTIEYVLSKRNENDRWVAENTVGPLDAPFAEKGRESKWVTYRATKMLKLAEKISI